MCVRLIVDVACLSKPNITLLMPFVNTCKIILYSNIDMKLRYKSRTNALQNRCYMCIQWTRVLYSVVITRQSNPPIPQFNSTCNEFTSIWSMFGYNTFVDQAECGKTTVQLIC